MKHMVLDTVKHHLKYSDEDSLKMVYFKTMQEIYKSKK